MLASLVLIVAALSASDALSTAERRELERLLLCPETLKGDAARISNTERFIARYAAFVPSSRMGVRMRLRDDILAKKKCRRSGPQLGYTFPES